MANIHGGFKVVKGPEPKEELNWVGAGMLHKPEPQGFYDLVKRFYLEPILGMLKEPSLKSFSSQPEYEYQLPSSIHDSFSNCELGMFARLHEWGPIRLSSGVCWYCEGEGLESDTYEGVPLWTDCSECKGLGYLPTIYTATCNICGKTQSKGR